MIDVQQLTQWKLEWRRMVADNITGALSALEERLPNYSPKFNTLIALRGRLNDANRNRIMGVMSNEDLQLEYNRIRQALLELIEALELDDFLPQPLGAGAPGQRGLLLHKIPARMEVNREVVCIIRLAFDEAAIVRDIDLDEDVEVKQIAVSKVMHAELIDPNAEPAFSIRTYSDEEQFLQKGEYTEWKYYVKPLREGTFALLLKVSVVEKVEGEDRRRNLSWEEKVQIVTDPVEEEPVFQAVGLAVGEGATEEEPGTSRSVFPGQPAAQIGKGGIDYSKLEDMIGPIIKDDNWSKSKGIDYSKLEDMIGQVVNPAPPPFQPMPASPSPQAPARRRGINIRRLSIAATILLVVGIALFQIPAFYSSKSAEVGSDPAAVQADWKRAKEEPSEESFKNFLEAHPAAPEAEDALWELARLKSDTAAFREYLEKFPQGKYAEEARKWVGE